MRAEASTDAAVPRSTLAHVLDSHGPLQYEDAVDMLSCLVPQLSELEARGLAMPSIEPEDVAIVGPGRYDLVGLHRAWGIEERVDGSRAVVANAPPVARTGAAPGHLGGDCLPPELQGAIRLPCECTPAATYFSLAMLVRRALGLHASLAPLAGSKLYYCLKRCLRPEPERRRLFFI